jgi:hypothetical protein
MTIPLLIQIRRLPSLTISLPGSVSTNLLQFGLTTAWESRCPILARLHLLGPIFAIFAGLFAGKPLYPMTRTVWNRL